MISRNRTLPLLLILIANLTVLRAADNVVLKTGETISGKILEENADTVVIEYKVSATITDQKSIPRADIAKVEKEQLDEIAFIKIQGFKCDPEWSLQRDTYDRLLSPLNAFLVQFPKSAHAAEVQQNFDALAAEKARVANGEMKLFGNWLTKEQAEKQQGQGQAQAAFTTMREQAMQGDLTGALNVFETMKTSCRSSLIFPGAVQLAGSLMQNLQHQITSQKQAYLKEEENWKNTIAMATEPKKSQFIAAHHQTELRAEASLAAAQKSTAKWTPIIPHSLKSLEELERTITSEKAALLMIPVAKMKESITLANKAADAITANDLPAAEACQLEAQTLWPENSALEYIKTEIARAKLAATPPPVEKAVEPVKAKTVAVAEPTPVPEPPAPFYMTSKGASMIVVGLLLLIGLGTLAARLLNKPEERADQR